MSRELYLYLAEILDSISKIERFTANTLTAKDLAEDEKTFDAVAMNLQIIGEAVKYIPNDIRETYPQIPWASIVGLRNIIAHVYTSLDAELIWDTVQTKLPALKQIVTTIQSNQQ